MANLHLFLVTFCFIIVYEMLPYTNTRLVFILITSNDGFHCVNVHGVSVHYLCTPVLVQIT